MKIQMMSLIFAAAALAGPTLAQSAQLPIAPAVEKELAARASNVTEVTLGKNMLAFAAKFMNGKDQDEAATQRHDAVLAFSEDGAHAQGAPHLLANHHAAQRWRQHHGWPEFTHLLGDGAAQVLGRRRVLQHQRALHVPGAVKPRTQAKVALEQGA